MVSKFRPKADIIAITPFDRTQRRMQIYWGITSYIAPMDATVDEMLEQAMNIAVEQEIAKAGDAVVITAGSPNGLAKGANTNLIKVERIK